MNEIQLKYGCNPNQKPSRIFMDDDRESSNQGTSADVLDISISWMLSTDGSW